VKKATVLRAKWFIKSHVAAIMLERAGKVTEARAAFNELLNFSQLTLGIINRDGLKPQYAANTPVEVMVSIVDAPDLDDAKNKLETTHKALVADSMVPLASVNLSKGGDAYDIEAMLMDGVNITGGDEEEEEVPAPKPEPKATKKAAK
jgi:hypothetical protein